MLNEFTVEFTATTNMSIELVEIKAIQIRWVHQNTGYVGIEDVCGNVTLEVLKDLAERWEMEVANWEAALYC